MNEWAVVVATALGAAIAGVFTLINLGLQAWTQRNSARLEQQREEHRALVEAAAEYLEAVEQFIRALLNTPPLLVQDPERWVKTANFRLLATTLANAVLRASGKSGAIPPGTEGAPGHLGIDSRFYAAAARLRLVGPAEVLDVMDEVEDLVKRWQKTPRFELAEEWPKNLRRKVMVAFQPRREAELADGMRDVDGAGQPHRPKPRDLRESGSHLCEGASRSGRMARSLMRPSVRA